MFLTGWQPYRLPMTFLGLKNDIWIVLRRNKLNTEKLSYGGGLLPPQWFTPEEWAAGASPSPTSESGGKTRESQ